MIDAPQIEPVSTLSRNYQSIFAKLGAGPVFLAHRSKPAAVLVSIDDWKATADELKRLRRIIAMDRQLAQMRDGDSIEFDISQKPA